TYTTIIHTTQSWSVSRSTTFIDTSGWRYTAHILTTITSTYCWTETKWYYTWVSEDLTEETILSTSTEPVPNELVVHLTTDKSEYIVGDYLDGEIWVTDEYANSIEGARVEITYVFNGRISGDESAVTNVDGEVLLHRQWGQEHIGDWEIIASASKEGYDSASNSVKLSVYPTGYVPKEQLTITIQTDRGIYEQGEAVTVSGQVRRNNEPTPPKDRAIIIEVLQVPNRKYTRPYNTFVWYTDESGRYSVMPFAGWEIGEYVIRATCSFDTEEGKITVESKPWSFHVEKATLVKDMRDQVRKITELYQDPDLGIPEGPLRRAIVRKNEFFKPPKIVEWGLIPESSYGAYTNLLHLTTRDPKIKELLGPYTCGGCQAQTLEFMDRLRFHEDPEVRKLVKGLDYGPISRGGGPLMAMIGSHHAVVLYPIGTDWRWPPEYGGQFAKVFDPWPTQKPEVYYVEQFERPYGFARVSEYYQRMYDPSNLFSGYPLTGGAIYVNYNVIGKRPAPPPEEASTAVVVDCPVDVLITDPEGRRAGMLPDDILVQEFPAYIYQGVEDGETTSWYFGLPEGTYTLEITGRSAGTFNLLIGGEAVGDQILKYGEQEIPKGGVAKVTIGTGDKSPPLSLPNGETVNPESFKESKPISNLKLGALIFTAALILGVILLVKRSYSKQKSKAMVTRTHQAAYRIKEKISEGPAFCEECGRRIPADSMFCPYCGDKQGVK
ncbi:MAG: zinc-ribbon domain-containing protein, partial [Candidatus Bathyarchaeia archaeon]